MNTLLIIDGNAVMHRAYHAIPLFKTKEGIPTNVIYGFFSILNKTIIDFQPTNLIVCFDTPTPTFRKIAVKEYQAHRPKIDDDLIIQIPNVKKALTSAGVFHCEKPGFEADDLIGTFVTRFKKQDIKIFILTGDKDIMQLVDKNVYIVAPRTGISEFTLYDIEGVIKRMGVEPTQIPNLKALMGDPSDNYKGAKGIGPKTAAKLLLEYHTLENIYNNINYIKNDKVKHLLIEHKTSVDQSKMLATILTDVEMKCNLSDCEFHGFKIELKDCLLGFGIKSLAERLFKTKSVKPKKENVIKDNKDQLGLF